MPPRFIVLNSHGSDAEVATALAQIERVYSARNVTELRDRYDDWAGSYDRQVVGALGYNGARHAAAALARYVPPRARVLDAGAGTGLAGAALRDHGFSEIWAADISPRMIRQAQAKHVYRRLLVADIEQELPLDPIFEAVIATGVFTRGHASPQAFGRLLEVLLPGGILCITLRADSTASIYHDALSSLEVRGRLTRLAANSPFRCFATCAAPRRMQIVVCRAAEGLDS